MNSSIIVLFIYFSLTLFLGLYFRKRAGTSTLEFYLAGRDIRGLLLFFTMAATNFSAFTIFGLSGAGYRMGYAFFPIMGFGTGFMALTFIILGKRIHHFADKNNYMTPADFIAHRYASPRLKLLVSGVLVFFTLPYIAIQAVSGGKSLETLSGIPYHWGAFIVTSFIVLYVFMGGLRSIVWTDFIQGIMMLVFTLAAFIIIAVKSGGFTQIHSELLVESPEHFTRAGVGAAISPGIWFSYLFLWFFADPMFPQLFQRFLAARDQKALNTTVVLYPLITTFLFFMTISIGVMGRSVFPGLPPGQTDSVFPMLLRLHAGKFLGTILLTGSLAALMSTMDSQLLSLTSIIQQDFLPPSKRGRTNISRVIILVLGILGFLIAMKPPSEILSFVNKTTFNGLSVLAPAFIGGLYWRRANKTGAAVSILFGEVLVVLFYLGILNVPGLLPVIPILAGTGIIFVLVSMLSAPVPVPDSIHFEPIDRRLLLFIIPLVLASEPWNWTKVPGFLVLGLPLWIWRFFFLGLLLSAGYFIYLRMENHNPGGGR